jgi:hypothetical protein
LRKTALVNELEAARRKAYGNAKSAYLWSQFLFILALGFSVAAAVSGVFFDVSAKIVGGIAALPPLIGFVAVNLKLEGRSSWHYRKSYGMDALRSRLLYQLPEEPTVDNIAAIAEARDKLNDEMQDEWERTITVSWGEMLKQKSPATPRSGGPTGSPSR